jgi:NAD(P)-dependent dehydrogenase (short-subunit alcohol dehydrogenase family)
VTPRRALVTGGMRGVGAAVVARLRADGFEVETLDLLPGATYSLDLAGADPLPVWDDIDVLVSNAAITNTIAPAHRMSDAQWDRDLAVNLTGAYRVVRACLPGMRQRGYGRIVVVSSLAATQGLPGQVAYAASKAGLLGMAKTVAAEQVQHGITVNAVLPGMVDTEVVAALPADLLEIIASRLPSGRMASPEEVASLIAYLVGDDAGHVTGQEIAIAGGADLNTFSLTRASASPGGPA